MNINQVTDYINTVFTQGKPEGAVLMNLYITVGKSIVKAVNTTFMSDLVKEIAKNCPTAKGFSLRNVRRMRDFYTTYENQADLLEKVQEISWALNVVIMEQCTSTEEKEFYLNFVLENSPTKVELEECIKSGAFENNKAEQVALKISEIKANLSRRVANVSDFFKVTGKEYKDSTTANLEQFIRKSKHVLQGSSPPKWGNNLVERERRRLCLREMYCSHCQIMLKMFSQIPCENRDVEPLDNLCFFCYNLSKLKLCS